MLKLIKGEDKEIFVKFEYEDGKVYKLNSVTEIKAIFIKDDGTKLEKTQTGGHIEIVDSTPQNGEIKISLTDADTALIKKGDKQSFEVELHEGTKLSIVQFKEELQVLTRI